MSPRQPTLANGSTPAEPAPLVTLHPPAQPGMTPMDLLAQAIQRGADMAAVEKLMDLQERWQRNEARKAFYAAMAAFKANPPELFKNKHVRFTTKTGGTTEYDHATLDEIALKISAAMSPHGLSFRWETLQTPGRIRVICHLQHLLGHTEPVVLEGPADDSGSKNQIQQIGSTVTYLQRYTLLSATGMAVKDQDDDGRGAGGPWEDAVDVVAVPGQLQGLLDAIAVAKDLSALAAAFNAAYKSPEVVGSEAARRHVLDAKNIRQAQLKRAS